MLHCTLIFIVVPLLSLVLKSMIIVYKSLINLFTKNEKKLFFIGRKQYSELPERTKTRMNIREYYKLMQANGYIKLKGCDGKCYFVHESVVHW